MSREGNPQDLEGATVVSAEAAPRGEGDWWVLRLRLADGTAARLYADSPTAYVDESERAAVAS